MFTTSCSSQYGGHFGRGKFDFFQRGKVIKISVYCYFMLYSLFIIQPFKRCTPYHKPARRVTFIYSLWNTLLTEHPTKEV